MNYSFRFSLTSSGSRQQISIFLWWTTFLDFNQTHITININISSQKWNRGHWNSSATSYQQLPLVMRLQRSDFLLALMPQKIKVIRLQWGHSFKRKIKTTKQCHAQKRNYLNFTDNSINKNKIGIGVRIYLQQGGRLINLWQSFTWCVIYFKLSESSYTCFLTFIWWQRSTANSRVKKRHHLSSDFGLSKKADLTF